MFWHLYLRKRTVYVPTVARTEASFYISIEPVRVVMATDSEAVQRAIKEAAAMGNPIIPTPTRAAFPKPVVLKYAKVNSWSVFAKDALIWGISEKEGNYQIMPGRKGKYKGGWEYVPEQMESLPPGTTIDTIAKRLASLVLLAQEEDDARHRSK